MLLKYIKIKIKNEKNLKVYEVFDNTKALKKAFGVDEEYDDYIPRWEVRHTLK